MKKLSAKQKLRQIRLQRRRDRKHVRDLVRIKVSIQAHDLTIARYAAQMPFEPFLPNRHVPLAMPRNLSLSEDFEETSKVLNNLRSLVLDEFMQVDLYFDQVELIELAAALAGC